MLGKTKHPLYLTWRAAIDRPLNCPAPVCLRWRSSFEDFVSDVGERPVRKYTPAVLVHLDTFKEFGPGNFAWMDRILMSGHVKKENHRQLMQEIGQPVPPYQAPDRLLRAVQLDTRINRRANQVIVADNYRKMVADGKIHYSASTRLQRHTLYNGDKVSIKTIVDQTGVDYNRLRNLIQKGRNGDEAVAYILAHPLPKEK